MNLLLIDDHNLFRSGLRLLLSDLDERIQFVETEGVEQVKAVYDEPIDLVLLDLNLRGSSRIDALNTVRARLPDATVVVLSSVEDPGLIRQCIDMGACGFIPKTSTPEVLVQALRLVVAGGIYLPPHLLGSNGEPSGAEHSEPPASRPGGRKMSPRQNDALMLAIQGKSNRAIGDELGVKEGTVKLHLTGAYKAFGVRNRTEAVYKAAAMGMIKPEGD